VWVARWTDQTGRRRVGWPPDIKGTYKLKREAQDAIDACYEREDGVEQRKAEGVTVGQFNQTWLRLHPRPLRTAECYEQRVRYVLAVELDGRAFRDWPVNDVRRKQANALVDHMLREQKRAADGARGVLRVLSAMWQDAIDDEVAEHGNPFMGLRIKNNDPRVTKPPRETRVWSWEQMHRFAAATGEHEPMLRMLADVGGLRIGELLGLQRGDLKLNGCDEQGCDFPGAHLHIRHKAYRRVVFEGTKRTGKGGRVAPVADATATVLRRLVPRLDTRLLFARPDGEVWGRDFYEGIWYPAQKATGIDPRPHEFRHSYVSLMRAAGVDPADLAAWTGHTVMTATSVYTHSTGASVDLARSVVG
jgi:integrase